ncbi:hypothetical protein KK083_09015 [Fulvivirgaceae bacterium PWU4]|uniref:Uncharacterized protein n=1 Tax=Chryseosolibacter histidini TaxID=2782349 RepID=A0AAP2GNZ8_9BACT|nr:hypothetical protein [Chryseosolibacter histidini]MBT1697012.1 hypothetical protein [Chryseosolibacter histidini]
MQNVNTAQNETNLSIEKIIDLIRNFRNDLVKDLLKADSFEKYFTENLNKELSPVKKQFIRKELKELLILPVDLVHYAKLITHLRAINSASITDENKKFFYDEVETIFKKYDF